MPDIRKSEVEERSALFVDLYNKIGCDALNIGGKDLALGLDKLKALSKKAKFPFVSANIVDPKTSKPLFKPLVIKSAAGFKFAITGVMPEEIHRSLKDDVKNSVKVLPPAEAIKALIPEMKKQGAAYIAVLSRLSRSEEVDLLSKVPEIDFILGGQDIQMKEDIYIKGSSLAAGCSFNGKHLCVTELHFTGSKDKGFVCRDELDYTLKKINDLTGKINDKVSWLNGVENRAAQGNSRVDPNSVKVMESDFEKFKKEQAEIIAGLKNYAPPDAKKNFFKFYYVTLDGGVGEDMGVKDPIKSFKTKYGKK
ncbi:MAG: hypothetical protein FJ088_03070 [Deltaproteobacteria bacterium]|nr:hypothetical protein [Deltaproteobacteria bacterium]